MNTFKTVMKYIKGQKILVVCSIVIALISSLTALFVPVLFGNAIDSIKELVIDKNGTAINKLLLSLILVAVVVIITAFLQWCMSLINNRITYGITRDIRDEAFEKIQRLPLSYLDKHSTGDIVSRMVADVDTLADGLLLGFSQAFTGVVTIIGTIFYMWRLSRMTTIVVVLVTPLSLFVADFIAKRTHDMFVLQSRTRGEQTALIDEIIGNEKVVKSFGYEKKALQRFNEINEKLADYSLKAVFFSSLVNPSTRFVNSVVYAVVALVGSFRVVGGFISVGSLSALLAYATQYTKPFNEISGVVTELQNAFACASRIFEIIGAPEESDVMFDEGNSEAESTEVFGRFDISSVDFSYTEDVPLIEDFNINIKSGQKVAIVGPTGCGKTTIINLLMRFYDINGGCIKIDGKDITHMTRQRHRERFGMVLQDTWIKNASVYDNIRIGHLDATDEECIAAAKETHAHSFIKRLPDGYNTILKEDGGDLSAGQKQLLCISRVMLALPPILILDEATSNIDTRTEKKIQEAFKKLMKGRTSFIVAHRLSTIMDADIIIAMRDGHIVETGSHEELLAKNGFYSELFNSQFES